MKERSNLSLGKVELKEVSRPNFNEFNIPIDAGKIRRVKKNDSTIDMNAGKKKRRSLHAGEVETTDIDAGKKRRKSTSAKSSSGKKSKKSSKSRKASIVGGNPNDKKTSLADLFKQVSIHLANQTSDIIAKGGDPSELLKDDIKFFSKK
jgi:hypothetical protein